MENKENEEIFRKVFEEKRRGVEELLKDFLPAEEGYTRQIAQAVNYSVMAGGKRIRPILLLEVNRLFNGEAMQAANCLAAAIEMIHTYSLVHDDLPAMDNDELRRGIPTTHKKFGEAMGILAGDALLNLSMETAMKAFRTPCDTTLCANAISLLYDKAGIDGMIGGQVSDVLSEKKKELVDKDRLDYIYERKTGALIEAAMMIGCWLAPQSRKKDLLAMQQIASKVGLAFQIRDDILDVEGIEEILGKPIGSDYRNAKSTYVTLMGIERAREDVERLTEEALALLAPYAGENTFLAWLIRRLAGRDR
ncbi:MAG: polyprenyl synthetase family protein [Lachnospiraceae bacterium]|nr:polyprenyl synthetase family protein [Lachnospiraceae bacterium]